MAKNAGSLLDRKDKGSLLPYCFPPPVKNNKIKLILRENIYAIIQLYSLSGLQYYCLTLVFQYNQPAWLQF